MGFTSLRGRRGPSIACIDKTDDAVGPVADAIHSVNGQEGLGSGSRGCANGQDPLVEVVAGDASSRPAYLLAEDSSSLSQAQSLLPQVGRFL